jgi:ParB-like chromosome segregation protein Spo0J
MIRKIAELKPYEKNARKHSQAQLEQIKNSIKEFGFTAPVLIDENNMVLAGHGRLEGAKLAGLKEVPVRVIEGLSEQQKRAYILADNKIALNAEWDEELLKQELDALSASFNLLDFGFSKIELKDFEISNFLNEKKTKELENEDKDEIKTIIVIECSNEKHQRELLTELINRGLQCQAYNM